MIAPERRFQGLYRRVREPRGCINLAHVPYLECGELLCPGCGCPVLLGSESAPLRTALDVCADYDLDLPHP